MNVEEYRYDYAGNRIVKITELNTINYLVDTNGALSQVLAEYDENGSLKTYYTRGAELISQERGGEKHYYLYDGFDSVRILTDEGGTATDFYTFDAFGNLTEQIGDTENSYLYRGEQYDAFTGLYYLRARYMNPATGTFITMDEYAGSVFEPVSLHKYLYANANPVMFCDPSGYFSLSDVSASLAINNVLQNMEYGACMGAMLNGMLSSLLTSLRGGTSEEVQQAFLDGMASGFIFGGLFGGIGAYASVYWQARLLLAAVDFMGGYYAFRDAFIDFANGNILAGIVDIGIGVQNAFSSANGARAARGMYGERLGKQNSTPKTADNSIKGTGNTPKSLNSCSPQEISNMNRKELKNATPSNWKFYDNNGRIHIKDENQKYRVRVDPPDKKTPYTHIHIYDSNHNLVDINGNPVSDTDINGHIPYIY